MSFEYDAEVTCEECDGDGGWDQPQTGQWGYLYDPANGSLITDWRECRACEGRGTIWVHMRPIDFEDLDTMDDEDSDPHRAFAYRGGNP